MITTEIKLQIVEAINANRTNYKSDAKLAVALGINPAQLSTIRKGNIERVLSDANWISIARRLGVMLGNQEEWKTAETPTYTCIYSQLKWCQENSQSGLFCDKADIGKTFTARSYVKDNKNAVYIDCSQVKSKQKLVRQIAREYGINHTGRYMDVYDDLVYYLRTVGSGLIILDEAGDLDYAAFLEIKALWNATEGLCAWYMMGADALKAKIENNMGRKKVGYAEIFSRFGSRYQRITPAGSEEWKEFSLAQVAIIAKANYEKADIRKIYAATEGSLRRIPHEIRKQKAA